MSSKSMSRKSRKRSGNRIPNGSIPIPHSVIEHILARGLLKKREMQIVAVIIRDSWGYRAITGNGAWTKSSLANEDFVRRTEIAKSHISRTLKELTEREVILKKDGKYSFNEHFETWDNRKVTKKVTKKSYQKSNLKSRKQDPLSNTEIGQNPKSYQKGNFPVTEKVTLNGEDKPSINNRAIVNKKEIKKREIEKEKPLSSRKSLTNADIRKLIGLYHTKYTRKFGQKPMIAPGKDGAIAKRLLKSKKLEELERLLDQFFQSKWEFLDRAGSYSFSLFGSTAVINRLQKEISDQFDRDEWDNPLK